MPPNVPGSRLCRQYTCKFRAELGRGSCCRRCHFTWGDQHGRNCTGASQQELLRPIRHGPPLLPRVQRMHRSARAGASHQNPESTIGRGMEVLPLEHSRSRSPRRAQHITANTSAGPLCIICEDRQQDYAFQACGHLALCGTCHDRLLTTREPRCPICRTQVSGNSLRVFRTR